MDSILYGDRGLLAFEVKRTSRLSPETLKGLRSFRADYPMAHTILVYGGRREVNEGGIRVLPIETALQELPDLLN